MYHLRVVRNGEERNIELGYEYTKINLLKASTSGGHWLTDHFNKMIAEGSMCPELINCDPPVFIEIPGQVSPFQLKFGEEAYIVDSNGNTYERLTLKPWLSMDSEEWKKMWDKILM